MTHVWSVLLVAIGVAFFVSMPGSRNDVLALGSQLLTPQAAQQFAADSEKAANGDPDAAYRMGEAFESGRLGGLKDLKKALSFYRIAAKKGHPDAALRAAEIESQLDQSTTKSETPPISRGH